LGDHTIQITLTEVEGEGKIRGNTVGTPAPRSDWNQNDPRKADYIANKPNAVLYTSQKLTEEQKVQARANIGAASKEKVINLLPNDGATTTINGVTFTVQDDGRVALSGAATKETEFFFRGINTGLNYALISLPAGTYYLTGSPGDSVYAKYYLRMDVRVDGTMKQILRYGYYADGSRLILENDIADADMSARIVVQSGVNVDGVVFEPMLTTDPNAEYSPYGMTESEYAVAALQSAVEEHENRITVLEENVGGGVAPYFVDEVSATIDTITEKCGGTSLVLNIVTDTHEDLTNNESVRMCNEMYANIKAVNDGVYCDALIHLGDSCGSSQPLYPDWLTVNKHLQSTRKRLSGCNDHSVMLVGNHDGLKSMTPNEKITYNAMYAYTRDYVKRPGAVPYGYMDFEDRKTRCVFLSTTTYNDYTGGGTLGFGYDQFRWFIDVACATEDGWQLLIFSHYSPYDADLEEYYNANLVAKEIVKVLNAYTDHTEYSFSNYDISVSADFTKKTSTKAVAWVCGHGHYDRITKDNTYITEFDLCCPIIQTACARLEQENEIPDDNADGTNDADVVAPARITKTVTQDLWDTLVYRQDENKIYMIRFGAGEDRVIDLNS
jgi:hypothetical protein